VTNEPTGIVPGEALPPDPPRGAILRPHRTRLAGVAIGALAGVPLGALAVAVCCWLADYGDYAWEGAIYGAAGGVVLGAATGLLERAIRGDLVRPDVATCLGIVCGVVVAAVAVVQVVRTPAFYLFIGLVVAGPVGGLFLGGLLDRACEAGWQRRWGKALAVGGLGAAASVGGVYLIGAYSDPQPDVVAGRVREIILAKWQEDPETKGARIRKVTLGRPTHRTYVGTLEATIDRNQERFDLEVYVRHNTVSVTWTLRDE
jgi:hypothetical protein